MPSVKVQAYLDRVLAGASEDEFLAEFPHPVLVELEGQEDDAGAGALTERLDSQAIRLQSKSSRDANVFALPEGEVRVGRVSDADVRVEHKSVSKAHARFHVRAGAIELVDLDSTNGTYLNGRRLAPREAVRVRPDDTVRFGLATGFYVFDAAGFYQYLTTLSRFGF
ncbi:MAG: FHA domain-containing protein [Planctomycetota bacterium]|nr:MAG: FHA domain-containing protein [Planctomycetota bacterium]